MGYFEQAALFDHTVWRATIWTHVDLFALLNNLLSEGLLGQIGKLPRFDSLSVRRGHRGLEQDS